MDKIRIAREKWMQAGVFTDEQWSQVGPLILSQMERGKSFDEAVQVIVRLRNSPPTEG